MPVCFSKCKTGTNGSGRTAPAWVSIPVSSQLALTNQQGGGKAERGGRSIHRWTKRTGDARWGEVVKRRTPSLSRWLDRSRSCPGPTEPPGKKRSRAAKQFAHERQSGGWLM
ncbi:hypothetical protein I7I51_00558 [Histoplasma capsulatum]|uniref:Uncharacterized protein n=1 Tax=Ajellomyces capsulatus TaxID=5037 RepID=A0A8A1MEA6_AJECA|nr:hypothetical protein I7I51_00558 [Histoplasma capsulatum]